MGRKKKDTTMVVKVDVKDIAEAEVKEPKKRKTYGNHSIKKCELQDPPIGTPARDAIEYARKAQARALWDMYYRGELAKYHLSIQNERGAIEKDVLLSHKPKQFFYKRI